MDLSKLADKVVSINQELQSRAKSAINILLTLRNWMIGYYIVEYEQHGEDRAGYGDRLLETLAENIKERGVNGISFRNLNLYRQFYICYPEIWQTLSAQSLDRLQKSSELFPNIQNEIMQTLSAQSVFSFNLKKDNTSFPDEKVKLATEMIKSLSFSHITLLLPIESELKRVFYVVEAIKGVWSVRELKRQINSLYFERSGLSNNKDRLSELANQNAETEATIRNPMVFEFLGLPVNETLEESQLEKALMDNLQQFLLELGNGFCFEARQKRILIDDEYFYIDLVFYHRILRCHILIELKTEAFTHENIGQLNVYLQYYKHKEMLTGDNPPIGILLCTESKPQMVRYATADKENLTVNQYKLQLPSEKELQQFIEKQLGKDDEES